MRREVDIPLMNFCTIQHESFNTNDWLTLALPKDILAVAAFTLAYGAAWYGHRNELLEVGRALCPEAEHDLLQYIRKVELYPSRFVTMIETRVRYDSALDGHR